jgi:hypothetical protein
MPTQFTKHFFPRITPSLLLVQATRNALSSSGTETLPFPISHHVVL